MAALITMNPGFCFPGVRVLSKKLFYRIQDKVHLKRFAQLISQRLHGKGIFDHRQITEPFIQSKVCDIRQQNFPRTIAAELSVDMIRSSGICFKRSGDCLLYTSRCV